MEKESNGGLSKSREIKKDSGYLCDGRAAGENI